MLTPEDREAARREAHKAPPVTAEKAARLQALLAPHIPRPHTSRGQAPNRKDTV